MNAAKKNLRSNNDTNQPSKIKTLSTFPKCVKTVDISSQKSKDIVLNSLGGRPNSVINKEFSLSNPINLQLSKSKSINKGLKKFSRK
mmetsp:Transcript_12584/g.11118  ORF Transcript_12584/g.11118 Transcript_12584/m.11118 type:complete len:87 (-) Transcript_12584:644-904(-)